MHTFITSSISKILTMWIWRHLGQIPVFFDIYIYMVEMANIKPKKAKRSLQMTTTRPKVA